MLCEKCMEREAVVTLTLVTDGSSSVHHFCRECAPFFQIDELSDNTELSRTVFRLLSDALSSDKGGNTEKDAASIPDIKCPVCGKHYREYREDGLLGCRNCLSAFSEMLSGTILSLQGADTHTGVRPGRSERHEESGTPSAPEKSRELMLSELRNELDAAVLMEHYGEAAKIRDRIRSLQASSGDRAE